MLKAIKHFNPIRGYDFKSNMTKNVELPLQNDGEYSIGEYDFKPNMAEFDEQPSQNEGENPIRGMILSHT